MDLSGISCLLNVILAIVVLVLLQNNDRVSDRLKNERKKLREIDNIINPKKYDPKRRY